MIHHVAILRRPYLELILQGAKTIESRLTRNRCEPFDRVRAGQVIHFKQSSGPYRCQAVARAVHQFDHLTPDGVAELARRFNDRIGGDDAYWQRKAASRYATFIELTKIVPIDHGPAIPVSHGKAWFVLK